MQTISLLMAKGIWQKIVDFFLGFFAFLPQTIYFLYSSAASLLDVLQYLVRKLAGLDVYYIDGVAQGGDIITDFLKGIIGINKSTAYSAISTVFWSLVIFGVILLILTSIVSIIKAHYNYDANKANPFTILRSALKSLATMVIVPIVAIFGVYLSQILLMTLDQITSPTASTAISSTYEADAANKFASDDDGVYTSYDYFSAGGYTKTPTFSGMLFKISAYNCNRVRSGYYTATTSASASTWDTMNVFYTASGTGNAHEVVAAQIDYAFTNNLKLKETYGEVNYGTESDSLKMSLRFGLSATFSAGLFNVKSFSKFNVGLVFYYYDLWSFNSIIGFAGVAMALLTLGNIVFGLMGRLMQVVALFVVYPAFIGIMPLDDGNAFGQWRKQFTSDILMAFGAVVGMNVFFLLLPYFNNISFFNNVFLDGISNMIIILAGLALVKKFIGLVSKFAGGGDANDSGSGLRQDTAQAAMKGAAGTLKAAAPAGKLIGAGTRGAALLAGSLGARAITGIHSGVQNTRNKVAYNKQLKAENSPKKKWKDMTDEEVAEGARLRADKSYNKNNKKKLLGFGREGRIAELVAGDKNDRANVTAEDREAYKKYRSLDKAEREAIDAGAVERDENGEIKRDENGNAIALKGDARRQYLRQQLGTRSTDARAQVAWANHKGASTYRRATRVGRIFGQDTSKYSATTAEIDENGNVQITKGTGTLKGFGQAALDFGGTLKDVVGSLTGASSAWKKLGESSVIDDAKTALQGLSGIHPTERQMKSLRTGKQKTDQEAEELKQMRNAQLKEQEKIAKNTAQTTTAIRELISKLENNSSSGDSSSGGSGTSGG